MTKNQVKLKNKYQKELDKIITNLKAYKPEKIILFGSMLNPKQESNDIDLFITKKTQIARLGERARRARKFLSNKQISVDLLIYTPYEVKKRLYLGDPFVKGIINKGKVLYGASAAN